MRNVVSRVVSNIASSPTETTATVSQAIEIIAFWMGIFAPIANVAVLAYPTQTFPVMHFTALSVLSIAGILIGHTHNQ